MWDGDGICCWVKKKAYCKLLVGYKKVGFWICFLWKCSLWRRLGSIMNCRIAQFVWIRCSENWASSRNAAMCKWGEGCGILKLDFTTIARSTRTLRPGGARIAEIGQWRWFRYTIRWTRSMRLRGGSRRCFLPWTPMTKSRSQPSCSNTSRKSQLTGRSPRRRWCCRSKMRSCRTRTRSLLMENDL